MAAAPCSAQKKKTASLPRRGAKHGVELFCHGVHGILEDRYSPIDDLERIFLDADVDNGIDVYRGTTAWTNCAGHQMCGTCIVDLTDGEALTNRKSNDEDATLNLQGCDPSCRLSCVTFVYGDVDVTVRPDREGGFFGSASSGSGW